MCSWGAVIMYSTNYQHISGQIFETDSFSYSKRGEIHSVSSLFENRIKRWVAILAELHHNVFSSYIFRSFLCLCITWFTIEINPRYLICLSMSLLLFSSGRSKALGRVGQIKSLFFFLERTDWWPESRLSINHKSGHLLVYAPWSIRKTIESLGMTSGHANSGVNRYDFKECYAMSNIWWA